MKRTGINTVIIFVILALLVCVPAINLANAKDGSNNEPNNDSNTALTSDLEESLPVVGTFEELKKLVTDAQQYNVQFYGGITNGKGIAQTPMAAQAAAPGSAAEGSGPSGDYSRTNVQVDGVDEADVVKTDGKYIYQANGRRIVIVEAYPASEMKIAAAINFDDKNFYPSELYVDGDYLTVIGTTNNQIVYNLPQSQGAPNKMIAPPYYYGKGIVKVIVYNIKNKDDIKELRQVEIEGNYVSSRKIGTKLYLVANKYVDYYLLQQGVKELTPSYKDTAVSNDTKSIPYDKIRYFPDAACNNYMIIGSMDISNNSEMKVQTYLGAGQNLYVSNNNLYAAVTKYEFKKPDSNNPDSSAPMIYYPPYSQNTLVYKFALNDGSVAFKAKGEVPGTILNQFSMDEQGDYFRIATTTGNTWGQSNNPSKNNIYVLDSSMKTAGKIEDIAPGEKIYSVRFMGDRGYLVTFQTVDPLFVVDFKDPQNPKILGALKIPGYSNYLHPYDENHIIGFGKDTIVLPQKDGKGNVIGSTAYYLGMKVALFDVSDVNNPKEEFSAMIGDRGTDSELLHNHKALLFSKEKNLLAFPVNLFQLKEGQSKINPQYGYPEYGAFTYQGAYIYSIDAEKGLTLRGRITHISSDEYNKMGMNYYGGSNNIQRILYINDTLYTLSQGEIKASDLDTLNEVNEVNIPKELNN